MSYNNIFITGASGKIGNYLLKRLETSEYNLILLSRGKLAHSCNPRIRWVWGDLLQPDSYAPSLKGIDTIIHMAAVTHTNRVSSYYEINAKGTLDLIRICRNYNVKRFIFLSTTAISEECGHYSKSKLIAENYVKESGLPWVILRIAEVYGTFGGKGIDLLLRNIIRFPFIPIIGNGEYHMAPIHISDVVSSLEYVIKNSSTNSRVYNITGPDIISYNQLIDKILEAKRIKRMKLNISPCIFKLLAGISSALFKDNLLIMDQLPRMLCKKSDNLFSTMDTIGIAPKKIDNVLKNEIC